MHTNPYSAIHKIKNKLLNVSYILKQFLNYLPQLHPIPTTHNQASSDESYPLLQEDRKPSNPLPQLPLCLLQQPLPERFHLIAPQRMIHCQPTTYPCSNKNKMKYITWFCEFNLLPLKLRLLLLLRLRRR